MLDDTTPGIEARRREILDTMTPEERLRMAAGMYDSALRLIEAGILAEQGPLEPETLRAEALRRMHGET